MHHLQSGAVDILLIAFERGQRLQAAACSLECIGGGLLGYAAVALAGSPQKEGFFQLKVRPKGRRACCSLDQRKGCYRRRYYECIPAFASESSFRQQTRSQRCGQSRSGTEEVPWEKRPCGGEDSLCHGPVISPLMH